MKKIFLLSIVTMLIGGSIAFANGEKNKEKGSKEKTEKCCKPCKPCCKDKCRKS